MLRSLALKLVLAFLVVSLIGVAAMTAMVRSTTSREFQKFLFDQGRESLLSVLAEYYQTHHTWDGVEGILLTPRMELMPRGPWRGEKGPYTLVSVEGTVLHPGMRYRKGDHLFITGSEGEAYPIEVDDQVVGWLIEDREVFRANPLERLFIDRMNRALVFSALGAIAVALILGIILSRTLTRPLREVTLATRAIAAGDLQQQVPVRSKDELGQLAESFNQMSAELARSQELRKQMTADIAHELRTPISIISGHSEAVEDGVLPLSKKTLDIIHDEAKRLERMVEDLRTLSRVDAGELFMDIRPVSLPMLLNRVASAYRPQAESKGIKLETMVAEGMPEANIDADRMSQVLGNLVRNALHYTSKNGRVTLSATQANDSLVIEVRDNGPGIEPQDLHHIFDRFYRPDRSRQRDSGGSGLGLAIVKSLVEAQGGQIRVTSQIGEGTSFVISLPT